MIVMHEVLSRPGEDDKPIDEQECWVLELLECGDSYQPSFVVQQSCGTWSEIDRRFMFDQVETERWPLLKEAEDHYETRRRLLVEKGFVHSDMDF
jgi:hypothetical protein